MLTIEIKINGRLIGGAIVKNKSRLADLSDYDVEAVETASPETGHTKDFRTKFGVLKHLREQTVWALVKKVAEESMIRRSGGQYDQEPHQRDLA
ncbi:hypothetical protein DSS3P1_28 [Ruegeria phage DSS3-P1]|uniref:hypothetical protein n=1 Tax=Ruegeria phage DSS3-P1 TaxID=1555208 RepID=UPI0002357D4B|nr:hypothetical protein DSS3P1_28 [Ruegeria phage DSS3-P1]YP_009997245.1 hypothetical protein JT312_gp28 [Ruegeria phage vB_RpoS-V18]YP_009997327.1 hypothetical protein JT313_gp28 [Ruegeria phage vB_RpoS-V11]YP_009997410.1 hypothetical protein JT314_gp29 [Ruegeria phage vB_RpoS-V7]AET42309.1 hypothetical protein SDSG_00044 [Ruegeria phage DSS3-P1]AIT13263.1 hypothetical protein DSS3P1_28 [Ruegeria phage DSS3-P1]AWY08732.1 hypothetical protein vBRpoSV7_29 [Ruegeria phage vB_RpoS-V7]AWY08904.1